MHCSIILIIGFLVFIPAHDCIIEDKNTSKEVIVTKLSNGKTIPLVGFGVGNLEHELINKVIDEKVKLIDTARASHNEHIIANSIARLKLGKGNFRRENQSLGESDSIHVITKVWYTHLGYERTRLSVFESLKDLSSASNIRVHILLHWPRCDDSIQWMRCEEEEHNIPQYVKDVGSAPHLDKENAWKESWRALEDMYDQKHQNNTSSDEINLSMIESIGVSNFGLEDMQDLMSRCRIKPSIYQGNVWLVLYDPDLMTLLRDHQIVFQAYNVMHGLVQQQSLTPNASTVLSNIAKNLSMRLQNEYNQNNIHGKDPITEAMVIMAWLVQNGIAIIPRVSSYIHQRENYAISINTVPELTKDEKSKVRIAMSALMQRKDMVLEATFHNALFSGPVQINWLNTATGEEVQVIDRIHPGESKTIQSHTGHTFVVYDEKKELRKEYIISSSYGEKEHFYVDEL